MQVSEGVSKQIVREGTGNYPKAGDSITVHCTGCLTTPPKKFWSTKDAGQQPFTFQVGLRKVIAGWDEGCLQMRKGEVARLTIAGHKGYGASGFPAWGITPNAELLFEIEILTINGQ
ncbi:PREDICTED: peptidyl-prolyl cis-trans isomerase FKBP12-like [Priapulus caudatus]|uniref:peptidylprolyl isomerase n=1 Tax=Priapulus caudatus TaxID=37621 RepID=A0ABM1E9G8_PRICU|nr:PREDICTED: peptidyl-prolyl cis-trans isomerase FKBP12-like [Priapulus caudatus]